MSTITLLCVLSWSPDLAVSAWTVGKPIITYYAGPGGSPAYPLTNAAAAEIAAGGWNTVWAHSVEGLNVAQAHGLRVIWTGSQDYGTVMSIKSHPALYGYFVTDEPSAAQFPALATTVSNLRTWDPNHVAHINLFPTYATNEQLAASDYRDYLNKYMIVVRPNLLSYDHYQFQVGKDTPDYFKNLAIVSYTAKQAGIPFLNVVQACSWDPTVRIPNGNELRYLYNTSLAYGAAGVDDFIYRYDDPSFSGGMNEDGTPTPLYYQAKAFHPEFMAIAEQVRRMIHIGAYHLGDLPPGYGTTDGSSPQRLPDNSPFTITGVATTTYQQNKPVKGAVMGLFGSGDRLNDAACAMVVNLNYSAVLNTRVTGPGALSVFNSATGDWIAQGHPWADVSIAPGGSVLVGLTSAVPEPASMIMLGAALATIAAFRRWKSS
jgi:hypothetical protein